jgi:hypothetical protein
MLPKTTERVPNIGKGENEMQETAAKKLRHAWTGILFAFLSALSAAATAVVPLIIHN